MGIRLLLLGGEPCHDHGVHRPAGCNHRHNSQDDERETPRLAEANGKAGQEGGEELEEASYLDASEEGQMYRRQREVEERLIDNELYIMQ